MNPRRPAEDIRLTTHAEVLTPNHPIWQAYLNGSKETPPGRSLGDVLNDTGGLYEMTLDLPDRFVVDICEAAAKSQDPLLVEVARTGQIWIPFEHLRGLDPNTRVSLGCSLGPNGRDSDWSPATNRL